MPQRPSRASSFAPPISPPTLVGPSARRGRADAAPREESGHRRGRAPDVHQPGRPASGPQVAGHGDGEPACRRDSVRRPEAARWPSICAAYLGSVPPRRHWTGRPSPVRPCSGWGLPSRPGHPGRWCALAAPFHPCLSPVSGPIGGLFSVALSCGSPRLAASQHPALWSPDLPRPGRCRAAATRPTHRRRSFSRTAKSLSPEWGPVRPRSPPGHGRHCPRPRPTQTVKPFNLNASELAMSNTSSPPIAAPSRPIPPGPSCCAVSSASASVTLRRGRS